ncbi:LacI family DNA-binding transcriptional regulator [Stackebrandtia nassauensis]|uniref:Transcriptional regulator, LacI family n=1 Tax=Stackebrandtia nassauensis (strain DSM 44728 / CIP 108903 / NRRL B-16338 / NBRC 102104 / LLR-40K-21) TaxID=446470 RepID=D3PWQ8_STANL|nr:LacI family DNA-binding transcriptional regulator [Stackebrandtia nassauensis]ADD43280.1 transcriptional regulator, LacI family [Stackebrandtia nassauensis DSM 44728]
MANMKDVAKLAGVSVSTVSHIINGTRFVKEDTKNRVMDAIRQTGYIHNTIARSLVTSSTQTIGLAISAISNFYFADIIAAIERSARASGHTLLLADTHDDLDEELRVVQALHQRRVDGVLLATAGDADSESLQYLQDLGVPTVLVDRCASTKFDQVGTENIEATAELTGHLTEHGHQRIGLIAGRELLRTTVERERGWRLGLQRANLKPDRRLVASGQSSADFAEAAVERLLSEPDPPTALVVANNHMTIGVMSALTRLGVSVPDDLALAVFDDFEWANYFHPRLTAMAQPIGDIGACAIETLLSRIADPKRPTTTVQLPATFKRRESCGCQAPTRPAKEQP